MGMVKEFKEFAIQGNVMDLAVGVIIGGAFGTIVTSVVNDLIMPVVGMATGGKDFSNFYLALKPISAEVLAAAGPSGHPTLAAVRADNVPVFAYGNFLTVLFNFLILAFIIFQMVKMMNRLKRAQPAPAPAPVATPEDILLLREIRDNLKR